MQNLGVAGGAGLGAAEDLFVFLIIMTSSRTSPKT
jgi:hypothetical protein